MGKAVDDLKRILERMQKDLDKAPSATAEPPSSLASAPAEVLRGRSSSGAAAEITERQRPAQSAAPVRLAAAGAAAPRTSLGTAVLGGVSEDEARDRVLSPVDAWAAAGGWHRALLLGWVAVSLGGVWVEDRMIVVLGLLGLVWLMLRTSILLAMRPRGGSGSDLEDIHLRVTALEKRVAALRQSAGAAGSTKLQEDILELKTILKSLFKALEESPEGEGKNENADDD